MMRPGIDRPLRVLVACEFSGTVRDAFAARGHFARSVDLLRTESLSEPVKFRADFGCMEHETMDPTCEACEHEEPWCHEHGMFAYECPCLGPTEDEAEYADTCEHGARHLSGDLFSVEDIDGYDLLIAHPPCTYLANSGAKHLYKGMKKENGKNPARWEAMRDGAEFFRRILALPIARICVENPIMLGHALSIIGERPAQVIQPWMFGHGETKATCLWLKNLPTLTPTNVVAGREPRIHMLPPSADRWKLRSKTFQGIADAMADQWGGVFVASSAA